jgi:hypothetical protein
MHDDSARSSRTWMLRGSDPATVATTSSTIAQRSTACFSSSVERLKARICATMALPRSPAEVIVSEYFRVFEPGSVAACSISA